MIVAMKKITLVVLDRERKQVLEALRKIGVLHIQKREGASQTLADLTVLLAKMEQALSLLDEIKISKKTAAKNNLDRSDTIKLVDRVLDAASERHDCMENIAHLRHEIERLEDWGPVDPENFTFLSSKGVHLTPFEIPSGDFSEISPDLKTIMVNRGKKSIRFLLVRDTSGALSGIPDSAHELMLPEISSAQMKQNLDLDERKLPLIADRIAEAAPFLASIISVKNSVLKDIEFESIRAEMVKVDFSGNTSVSTNAGLAWLTGFIPSSDEPILSDCAKSYGWAFVSEDPSPEDAVPTKLKNNRLVNLISPLMDFLGITPGYNELDISLWFILFFGIFFAMIFGDGGYGLLVCAIAAGGIFFAQRKKIPIPTVWFMLLYLGAMTVAWGVITCTWFGLPVETIPVFLKAIALPAFSNENPESATNIKIFCFTLGLIQISLAHIIGVIRNIRSPKMMGEIGTLMMTGGMYCVVLNLVVDAQKYPLNALIIGIILAGFLLNFVFINYSGSIVGGILESLKNSISMFLGVVNVFGDIMSYIRLWAVGLAGAAISATVNSMVGPMFGSFFMFLGLLLLTFGHGLNLIMNVLSVIVHGVRLNTLEFSNHLGLTWSGFKYEPFSETVRK